MKQIPRCAQDDTAETKSKTPPFPNRRVGHPSVAFAVAVAFALAFAVALATVVTVALVVAVAVAFRCHPDRAQRRGISLCFPAEAAFTQS
jgi:hypothetical protein